MKSLTHARCFVFAAVMGVLLPAGLAYAGTADAIAAAQISQLSARAEAIAAHIAEIDEDSVSAVRDALDSARTDDVMLEVRLQLAMASMDIAYLDLEPGHGHGFDDVESERSTVSADVSVGDEERELLPVERRLVVATAPIERSLVVAVGTTVSIGQSEVDSSESAPSEQERERTRRQNDGDAERWAIPVEDPRITSRFGPRIDPITGQEGRMHRGTDFGAVTGTDVFSSAGGRVVMAGWCTSGTGNCVVIDHEGGWRTQYFHLSEVHTRAGATIAQGERIGEVGSTGRSTGPHLHFQLGRGSDAVDAERYFGEVVQ